MTQLCEHNIPHADCGHCVEPHLRVIAVGLPVLEDLSDTLFKVGLIAESKITDGLLELLAELVMSGSPPDSEEYAAADAVLNPPEETP